MEIKDAIKKRQDLEIDILRLLKDFKNQTRLNVQFIELRTNTEFGSATPTVVGVVCEIKI